MKNSEEPSYWIHSSREKRSFRWWLHMPRDQCFHGELYVFWKTFGTGVDISALGESAVVLHFGCGLFCVYLVLDSWPLQNRRWFQKLCGGPDRDRELSVNFFDGGVSVHPGFSGKHMETPYFSFYPMDFFLGRSVCREEVLSVRQANLTIPAGHGYGQRSYDAKVTERRLTITRPRLPFWKRVVRRWETEVAGGVPHQGKGTEAWNCREGRLFSVDAAGCTTIEEAHDAFVKSVMDKRGKYPL